MKLRQDTPFVWVPGAARYRDVSNGRFVSIVTVQRWSNSSVSATQDVVTQASEAANDDPAAWFDTMRTEIKTEYIRQYLAGIGGRNNMTQADWGRTGGMIADQYRYLNDFLAEVQTGDLSPEAIAARSRMYINSAKEAFAASSRISHTVAGYTEQIWLLGATEQHCENCPDLAAMGWMPIDFVYTVNGREALPGNGATQCLTNCDCRLAFRK